MSAFPEKAFRRFNVINVTRAWVGSYSMEKSIRAYLTLEWPPRAYKMDFLIFMAFTTGLCDM